MEESVQLVIMQSIQELESGGVGGNTEDAQIQRLMSDLSRAVEERDQMEQKCHELDMQVNSFFFNFYFEAYFTKFFF